MPGVHQTTLLVFKTIIIILGKGLKDGLKDHARSAPDHLTSVHDYYHLGKGLKDGLKDHGKDIIQRAHTTAIH